MMVDQYEEVVLDYNRSTEADYIATDTFLRSHGYEMRRSEDGSAVRFVHVGTRGVQGKPERAATHETFDVPWSKVRYAVLVAAPATVVGGKK